MNTARPVYLVAATLLIAVVLFSTVAEAATQNLVHILFLRVTGTDTSPLLCLITQEQCQQLAADKATTFELDEQSYTIKVSSQEQPDLIATWQIPEGELTTLAEGALQYAAGDRASAVSLWKRIPSSAELFANLAGQSQEPEESIHYYSVALDIAPSPGIYYGLGQVYSNSGDLSQAMSAFESAVALLENRHQDKLAARIHVAAGNISRLQNELPSAREYYLYALQINPQHHGALVGLARASRGYEQEQAQEFLEAALRTSPSPELYYELAKSYAATEQQQRAFTLLHSTPILESEFAPAMKFYGQLAQELGHSREAIEAYSTYLKLRPDDHQVEAMLQTLQSEAGPQP